jgi:16S rRNA (guanine527-N7)-methyltransferase
VEREPSYWRGLIEENGVRVGEDQFALLSTYGRLLREWNSKVNLISRKDEPNIWPGHIIHSISILFCISIPPRLKAADIGSGGGLPGIPLAILMPTTRITLIESIRKKYEALADIVGRLGISNAVPVHSRAEDLSDGRLEDCDVVFARAVAPLQDLALWSCMLTKTSSGRATTHTVLKVLGNSLQTPVLIAMKGGNVDSEIDQVQKKGMGVHSIDLRFARMEDTGLVDKKLIVVSL